MIRKSTVGFLILVIVLTLIGLSLTGFSGAIPKIEDDGSDATIYQPLVGLVMVGATPTPTPIANSPGQPLASFHTDNFAGPSNCHNCHYDIADEGGTDVTMSKHWRSTMMANATHDPLWQAKVRSETIRNPELAAEIEETCSRCHMPMAYTQAEAAGTPQSIFGDGFLNPDHPLHEAAMDGVSCTLCHQIQADDLGMPDSFSGHFVIDTSTRPPNRTLYGPYPDPDDVGSMIMRSGSGYKPLEGPHIKGSGLCGSCHTLFTPFIDGEGQERWFPEQTPFIEWLQSDFGDGADEDKQCQDCHMPAVEGGVSICRGWPEHEPFSQHHFVGDNVLMLRILQAHVEALGLRASTNDFANTIQRTNAQLTSSTATLSVEDLNLNADTVTAVLHVENLTGHKLPTGYPARRTWMHVKVTDAEGREVFESGRPLSHGGILGNAADSSLSLYEPHYDLITRPDQVQVYEAIIGDVEGNLTHTLLDATGYLKDNRLLPAGFDKSLVPEAVEVKGRAVVDDNFVGSGDQITYQIETGGYTEPFTLNAELLYQSVSYQFFENLRQDDASQIELFERLFLEADKTPVQLDALSEQIPHS